MTAPVDQHTPLVDDSDANSARFLQEAVDQGCVWGLEGPEGWALCPSEKYAAADVMPFWSQPEFAEVHCRDEWADYQAVPVALEEFLEAWLPGMHEDVYLVGVNWTGELAGDEWEPLDLLQWFEEALAS